MEKLDLSLILTCYNEGSILEESVSQIEEILTMSRLSYEIILVDDKSRDGSREIISGLIKIKKNRRFVFHRVNQGRGGAVTTGIKVARGKVIGFVDTDLEVTPIYIPHFVGKILKGDADGVTGHRIYREGILSIHRSILSRGFHFWLKRCSVFRM